MAAILKEQILAKSLASKAIDENELITLVNKSLIGLDNISDLPTPTVDKVGQEYMIKGVHYTCVDKGSSTYEWESFDTSGQNLNYLDASNKPKINDITLSGSLSVTDIGAAPKASSRTGITDPETKEILLGDSELITFENLLAKINTINDIVNLPKYEKYNNPILISSAGICEWGVVHSCKTEYPLVQVFTSGGILVPNLALLEHSGSRVSIQITSGVDIPANEYYVILIG